jgi:hypothetical protein
MQPEGVIKFDLLFTAAAPLSMDSISDLDAWRNILREHELIGQDPDRYQGYSYGNVSKRSGPPAAPKGRRSFIISGTQTGALTRLDNTHYVLVTACDIDHNRIVAEGPIRPSSEALTHGILYDLDERIRFVFHVHSSVIWGAARELGIPLTSPSVAYGTPAMAQEVQRLFRDTDLANRGIFTMGGHEDGVVSFGPTAESAGSILLETLAACRSHS